MLTAKDIMESENQTAESDTITVTKSGRPSRRNKTQPPTEFDKDQENIQSSPQDVGQLDQLKSIVAKVDENKLNTPDNLANSSTPRRKKDPLANLHSNLSPKYIGFVPLASNTDNSSEERPRSARRRRYKKNNTMINDSDTSFSRDSSLDMNDAVEAQLSLDLSFTFGYVRRTETDGINSQCSTPKHKIIKIKEFVSPIDKLLKKNGSIADSVHKLPMTDDEKIEKTDIDVPIKKETQNEQEWAQPNEQNNNEILVNIKEEKQLEKEETNVNQISVEAYAKDEKEINAEEVVSEEGEEFLSDDCSTTDDADQIKYIKMPNTELDMNDTLRENNLDQTRSDEEMSATDDAELSEINSPRRDSQEENSMGIKQTRENSQNSKTTDHVNEKDDNLDQMRSADVDEEMSVTEDAEIPESNSSRRDSQEENSMGIEQTLEKSQNSKTTDHVNEKDEWQMQNCTLALVQERKVAAESTNTIELKTEFNETEGNEEFNMEISSAISPSAISMDSATGSSIANEGSWIAYNIGDLYWGQIYNFCYWPCMVCPDPDGKTISTKEYSSNGDQCIMVHVRFFADKGRRNWVKRENLMPYTTLQSYQDLLNEFREKYGTKSVKFKQLVPKKNRASVWHTAVTEMEKVATFTHDKRMNAFFEIYENAKTELKHRRKSMNLPNGHHMSISDGESFYGSTENINLTSTGNLKRDRSVSPFSPAFSPVKSIIAKKRKVSEGNMEQLITSDNNVTSDADQRRQSQSSGISATSNVLDIYQSIEFENFQAVMKEFVLAKNQNAILGNALVIAVRNIWALKEVSREEMEHKERNAESKVDEKDDKNISTTEVGGDVKRLSQYLKRLSARKPSSTQQLASCFVDLAAESAAVAAVAAAAPAAKTSKDAPMNAVEKSKRIINRPILQVIDDIFELDNRYLFKGMTRDPVCKYCFKPGGNIRKCSKNCSNWLHYECLHIDLKSNIKAKRNNKRLNSVKAVSPLTTELPSTSTASSTPDPHVTSETVMQDEDVICKECANQEPTKCIVCNLTDSLQPDDPLVKCHMAQCEREFHPACCKYWPQSKITISKNHIQSFRCPSHVCHTCVSDDPKGKFQHISNAKITKCVKCPATYHTDSTCIPAGSQILTSAHIICPRHASLKTDMTVNVNWCFICVRGGQVVCCETCPTAVHAQCLQIGIDSNEGYICEECESGRMPLYGEIVWAKFNNFRWWPAIILPPTEIPNNIAKKPHNPSDFVVRFFGTHDHGWISRRRVYLYVEGDSSEPPKTKSHLDQNYVRGVMEAKEMYEIIKGKKLKQRNSNENKEKLHPQPYVRIKANRAVPPVKLHIDIESVSKCDCNPRDANPCGPESSCLNRVLYHECNPKVCPARHRCQNQMFESRISPRLDVVYLKERGFGLVSREPIPTGTFIIEYVGEVINDNEFRSRMSQKSLDRDENFYFLSVEKDYIIDAGPKGNLARFMNHSCDPNCETQKWSVNSLNRVGLFSIKDIPENTELTFNYHWDDLLGKDKTTCYCGSKNCAGDIGGKIKDSTKEPSPSADSSLKSKRKSTRKSKLKPLKRLASTAASKLKRQPKRKAFKRKSSKMIAAAALAAAKLGDDGND